jgi:hypothetical protein
VDNELTKIDGDIFDDFVYMLGVLTKASGIKVEGVLILSIEPENRWNGVGIQWNGKEYVRAHTEALQEVG